MKLSNLFKRTETDSLGDFVNSLKPLKKPHIRVYVSGKVSDGRQWPYLMRLEARLNSGEIVFFEDKGKISVADIPPDKQMAFANGRILAVPVEETIRTIKMFFPDSRISVWDLYGKARAPEEFMMYMRA